MTMWETISLHAYRESARARKKQRDKESENKFPGSILSLSPSGGRGVGGGGGGREKDYTLRERVIILELAQLLASLLQEFCQG